VEAGAVAVKKVVAAKKPKAFKLMEHLLVEVAAEAVLRVGPQKNLMNFLAKTAKAV
jgi:hypothetical protein